MGCKQVAPPPKWKARWCFGKGRVWGAGIPNAEMRKSLIPGRRRTWVLFATKNNYIPLPHPHGQSYHQVYSWETLKGLMWGVWGIITQPFSPLGIFLRIVDEIPKDKNIWIIGTYRHSPQAKTGQQPTVPSSDTSFWPRQGRSDSRHPCPVISRLQESFWNCCPICKDRR